MGEWICGKHPGRGRVLNGRSCPHPGCGAAGHGWTAAETAANAKREEARAAEEAAREAAAV